MKKIIYLQYRKLIVSIYLLLYLFVNKNDKYRKEKIIVSKYTLSFKFIYALEHVSKRRSEEVWMKNKVLTPWEILFIGIKKEILSTILKAWGLGEVDIYAYPRECCNHKF